MQLGQVAAPMARNRLAFAFIFALLFSAAAALNPVGTASAQNNPQLSMPQEYLNYTITADNRTLWAKIDGEYPMHLSGADGTIELPMFYPTPPNTTNMHVYLDGKELPWSNYTENDPAARHYTGIGDWQMIYAVVAPAAADFVLGIHYEHPVQVINGTYTFLYDLNISPYLSAETPNAMAHFTIRVEPSVSAINVYTTGLSGTWTPQTYNNTQDGDGKIVRFDITSEYSKPLWGDIAITLTNPQVPELQTWTILLATVLLAVMAIAIQHRARQKNR
jgi:hypothetical protein